MRSRAFMVLTALPVVVALASVALLFPGCSPAAAVAQLKDPCSELSWATVVAGCKQRIETECTAGDASCPVYVECSKARETWQACK